MWFAMSYREPSTPSVPKDLTPPVRQYSRWQSFRRWLVDFIGDTDSRDDRKWAGGHWARNPEFERHLGSAMTLSRYRWHPVTSCPHEQKILQMEAGVVTKVADTCEDCEIWPCPTER